MHDVKPLYTMTGPSGTLLKLMFLNSVILEGSTLQTLGESAGKWFSIDGNMMMQVTGLY